jgi:hypothetical protein
MSPICRVVFRGLGRTALHDGIERGAQLLQAVGLVDDRDVRENLAQRALRCRFSGSDNNGQLRPAVVDLFDQPKAGAARHIEIGNDDVDLGFGKPAQSEVGVRGLEHRAATRG